MERKTADKYLGCNVALTFTRSWFNEAMQYWVYDDEEYIGVLNRCNGHKQERFYQLDSPNFLPTDNACWTASRMKKIRKV